MSFRNRRRSNRRRHDAGSKFQSLESRIMLATYPANFSEQLMGATVANGTNMAFAPDGRLFVSQQTGQLRVIDHGVLQAAAFTTVTTTSSGERGLLGIAFDPDYFNNHWVYVYYTATTPAVHNRVSRFTADPNNQNVALAGSELVLLDLNNLSAATNHNGGSIHFGPDGKLYIAVGENANRANAQSFGNLLGKVLRMNKDGTTPSDNPYFNDVNVTGQNKLIWSLGLRNPFTFAFQNGTGRMFINDVGEVTWEEVNDGIAHSNYGWGFGSPTIEGFIQGQTPPPDYRDPLFVYDHTANPSAAIIGGAFYNPVYNSYPASYVGKYFFGDLNNAWIHYLDLSGGTPVVNNFATGTSFISAMTLGPDGSVYYVQRGGTQGAYRIRYLDTTQPTVGAPSFIYNEAKPAFGTSQRVRLSFNEYVNDSFTPSDLTITNLTTGQVIPTANISIQYDTSTNTANISFPGYANSNGVLPDGNYQVTMAASAVTDVSGNALASGVNFQFFALNGDFNRDRHVDSADQAIINANQGNNGTYALGDMNYDGTVNGADQTLFTPNLALWLPAAGTTATLATTGGNDVYSFKPESSALADVYANATATGSPAFRIYTGTGAATAIGYDGQGGTDILAIVGTSGVDSAVVNNISINFFVGAPINYSNVEQVTFDGAGNFDSLIVNNGATVTLPATQHFNQLSAAGTVIVAPGLPSGLGFVVKTFDVAGLLDMNDNDFILDYVGARGSVTTLGEIETLIRTARNGGAWNGNGITSSAAKNDPNHDTSLGAIEATDFKLGNAGATTFDGEPIDNSAVLVKYTYYGDTELNGKVDGADYARIDATFNQETASHADIGGWFNGDFDYNSKVDGADYALIDGAFNSQGAPLRPSAGLTLPAAKSPRSGIGLAQR